MMTRLNQRDMQIFAKHLKLRLAEKKLEMPLEIDPMKRSRAHRLFVHNNPCRFAFSIFLHRFPMPRMGKKFGVFAKKNMIIFRKYLQTDIMTGRLLGN